jgi:hypothetical protein
VDWLKEQPESTRKIAFINIIKVLSWWGNSALVMRD